MDDIDALKQVQIEWGCLTNIADRICTLEEMIEGGWPELTDMVADILTDAGATKEPTALFVVYSYLFRLYFRIKGDPEKKVFNNYSSQGNEFWISNYDFNTFKWALEHNFSEQIDNNIIKIPEGKLTAKQVTALAKRCEKGA